MDDELAPEGVEAEEPIEETPVEEQADEPPEEEAPEGDIEEPAEAEEPAPEAEKEEPKDDVRKEQNRLGYQNRKLENELRQANEKVAQMERAKAEAEQTTVEPPKLEDFESHEDWNKAYVDHAVKQGQVKAPDPVQQRPDPVAMKFMQDEQAIRATAADYDQVAGQFINIVDQVPEISAAVANFAMQQTNNTPEFIYEIAKDPDFAFELANTQPYDVGEKLRGRLNEINARKNPAKKVPAQEPPNTVKPRGRGGKTLADMTPKEIKKWALS